MGNSGRISQFGSQIRTRCPDFQCQARRILRPHLTDI